MYYSKNNNFRKNADSSLSFINKISNVKSNNSRETSISRPSVRSHSENRRDIDTTLPKFASLNSADSDNKNFDRHLDEELIQIKKIQILESFKNVNLNETNDNNLGVIANCLGIEKTRAKRKTVNTSSNNIYDSKNIKHNNKINYSPISSTFESKIENFKTQTNRSSINNSSNANNESDCFVIFQKNNAIKMKKRIDSCKSKRNGCLTENSFIYSDDSITYNKDMSIKKTILC
jgi:hypothetical protein